MTRARPLLCSLSVVVVMASLWLAAGPVAAAAPAPVVTQIAFTFTRSGNSDVWVMNADGTGLVQLTHKSASDYQPAWSPDGTQIAFTSTRSGNSDVWVMNADGTGLVQLTHKSASDYQPAWSPDGTQIAFTSTRSGNSDVWVMNADGTFPFQLTPNPGDANAGWSPDGSQLAYDSEQGAGGTDIMVINADGSGETGLTNGGGNSDPAWQPAPRAVMLATLDEPVGVVANPTRLLVTEECSDTLWAVHATGSVSRFATLPSTDNKCEERYLTQAPDGTYYVAANRRVYSVSAAGGVAEVRTLPASVPPQGIGITWDTVGTWGGQLVVTSNDGQIFELTTDGNLRSVATLGEQTESPRVVPAGFGSFQGDLLLSSKDLGQVQALAPDGTVTVVGSWRTPENADVVPSTLCSLGGQSYFVAVRESGQILAYPAGRLPTGQILVGSEIDTSVGVMAADGTTSTFSTGLATPADEALEGAAFCG